MVELVLHCFYIVKNSLFYFVLFYLFFYEEIRNMLSITKNKIMVIIMLDSYIIFERIVICKMLSHFTQIIISLFNVIVFLYVLCSALHF